MTILTSTATPPTTVSLQRHSNSYATQEMSGPEQLVNDFINGAGSSAKYFKDIQCFENFCKLLGGNSNDENANKINLGGENYSFGVAPSIDDEDMLVLVLVPESAGQDQIDFSVSKTLLIERLAICFMQMKDNNCLSSDLPVPSEVADKLLESNYSEGFIVASDGSAAVGAAHNVSQKPASTKTTALPVLTVDEARNEKNFGRQCILVQNQVLDDGQKNQLQIQNVKILEGHLVVDQSLNFEQLKVAEQRKVNVAGCKIGAKPEEMTPAQFLYADEHGLLLPRFNATERNWMTPMEKSLRIKCGETLPDDLVLVHSDTRDPDSIVTLRDAGIKVIDGHLVLGQVVEPAVAMALLKQKVPLDGLGLSGDFTKVDAPSTADLPYLRGIAFSNVILNRSWFDAAVKLGVIFDSQVKLDHDENYEFTREVKFRPDFLSENNSQSVYRKSKLLADSNLVLTKDEAKTSHHTIENTANTAKNIILLQNEELDPITKFRLQNHFFQCVGDHLVTDQALDFSQIKLADQLKVNVEGSHFTGKEIPEWMKVDQFRLMKNKGVVLPKVPMALFNKGYF